MLRLQNFLFSGAGLYLVGEDVEIQHGVGKRIQKIFIVRYNQTSFFRLLDKLSEKCNTNSIQVIGGLVCRNRVSVECNLSFTYSCLPSRSTSGSNIKAEAKSSRACCPPEKVPTIRSSEILLVAV